MTVTVRPVQSRFLWEIAEEIKGDWKKPYFGAVPYLQAMSELNWITDRYYAEDARTQVIYFLSNASTWRGEVAQRVKKELKALAGLK